MLLEQFKYDSKGKVSVPFNFGSPTHSGTNVSTTCLFDPQIGQRESEVSRTGGVVVRGPPPQLRRCSQRRGELKKRREEKERRRIGEVGKELLRN